MSAGLALRPSIFRESPSCIEGIGTAPTSDQLKHFGAAMASFGSIAMFHLVGITPQASRLQDVGGDKLPVLHTVGRDDVDALTKSYAVDKNVDVVVFSAPQLSLYELRFNPVIKIFYDRLVIACKSKKVAFVACIAQASKTNSAADAVAGATVLLAAHRRA
ncbi:MAG TPA: aconitase X [Paraburkholderia sp.]|nr:aconitase X [Paraburkholderia sp.]